MSTEAARDGRGRLGIGEIRGPARTCRRGQMEEGRSCTGKHAADAGVVDGGARNRHQRDIGAGQGRGSIICPVARRHMRARRQQRR